MALDIMQELADYVRESSKTADNLREQARLANRRADEIDEKAAQALRDATAIRDARNAREAQQFADRIATDQMELSLQ